MTVSNEREFFNACAADDKRTILMSACDGKFEGCSLAFADANGGIGYSKVWCFKNSNVIITIDDVTFAITIAQVGELINVESNFLG